MNGLIGIDIFLKEMSYQAKKLMFGRNKQV